MWGIASFIRLGFYHNLFVDKRNNLTLSFCINPSLGVGDTSTNLMVREIKTTKEVNLQDAVKEALKEFSSNIDDASVDIAGCYDINGATIESDCVETCKSGNFGAKVRVKATNGESLITDISGTFTVTEYDAQNCSFKVTLQINQ